MPYVTYALKPYCINSHHLVLNQAPHGVAMLPYCLRRCCHISFLFPFFPDSFIVEIIASEITAMTGNDSSTTKSDHSTCRENLRQCSIRLGEVKWPLVGEDRSFVSLFVLRRLGWESLLPDRRIHEGKGGQNLSRAFS